MMQKIQEGNKKNEQPKNTIFAAGSLVFGLMSVLLCTMYGGVLGIVGIILGIISLVRREQGRNTAIAGMVLSVLGLLLMVVVIIVMAMPTEMLQ